MDVAGKVAIVTGASSGVGAATASRLAKLGAHVAVNYHHSVEAAHELVHRLSMEGHSAVALQADMASDMECRHLVQEVVKRWGRLDVLVNNAGTTQFVPFADLNSATDEIWREIYDVNVIGPFRMVRAAADRLREQGGGEIVNVTSVAGITATGSSIPYACSKAALNTMTTALARCLAPQIRVNAVAPGFIEGRWLERGLGSRYDEVKQRYESRIPLHQVNSPDDVAACILSFITGPDVITGQVLVCDGGLTVIDPLGLSW